MDVVVKLRQRSARGGDYGLKKLAWVWLDLTLGTQNEPKSVKYTDLQEHASGIDARKGYRGFTWNTNGKFLQLRRIKKTKSSLHINERYGTARNPSLKDSNSRRRPITVAVIAMMVELPFSLEYEYGGSHAFGSPIQPWQAEQIL